MKILGFPWLIKFTYFFIFLFFQDDIIQITHTLPSSASPGTDVFFEIRLKIGNVSDFAKFNLDLPEGVTIKEKEPSSANFSQQGTIAKWVWQALPRTNEIILNCIMHLPDNMNGVFTITGKFSFIQNNEKKVVEMTPHQIKVGTTDESAVVAEKKQQEAEKKEEILNKTEEATKQDNVVTQDKPTESFKPPVAERIVEKTSENEYKVTVTIQKEKQIVGFFKFSDNLPEGMNARALQTEGASFSVADGKVKFVWVTVPEKEHLNISYVLTGTPPEASSLEGQIVYLENDQSRKVVLPGWTWDKLVQKQSPTQQTVAESGKDKEPQQDKKNEPVPPIPLPKDESEGKGTGNVVFRVQVGAFQQPRLSPSQFAGSRKLPQVPQTEMADGFTKYIIGKHKQYKQARDQRENVRGTVPSAFVVAYNGPARITVQEALMITRQKWFR